MEGLVCRYHQFDLTWTIAHLTTKLILRMSQPHSLSLPYKLEIFQPTINYVISVSQFIYFFILFLYSLYVFESPLEIYIRVNNNKAMIWASDLMILSGMIEWFPSLSWYFFYLLKFPSA